MRVLVIGGNRFFGKRLVTKLLAERADVTLLNRGQLGDPFGDTIKRITLDRKLINSKLPQLKNEKWDLIYDQACYEAADARRACETFEGRVSHYVFTSSASVYETKDGRTEEDFEPTTYPFTSDANWNTHYAEAKRQCEAIFAQQKAFPITAIRFSFVLGADDYTRRLKFHIEKIAAGEALYFPNIEAKISLTSVEDAARALHYVSSFERAVGPVNCASPEPISLRDLLSIIEKVNNRKAILLREPNEKAHSPYGVSGHSWLKVKKIQGLGFHPSALQSWLPQLIEDDSSSI